MQFDLPSYQFMEYSDPLWEMALKKYTILEKTSASRKARVLCRVHYFLKNNPNWRDGRPWVYNSINQWCKQFPTWPKSTVERAFDALRKDKLLIVGCYNQRAYDFTNWYTINYELLSDLLNRTLEEIKFKPEETKIESIEFRDGNKPNVTVTDGLRHGEVGPRHGDGGANVTVEEGLRHGGVDDTNESSNNLPRNQLRNPINNHVNGSTLSNVAKTLHEVCRENACRSQEPELLKIIDYFWKQYKTHRGEEHPSIGKGTLTDAVIKLSSKNDYDGACIPIEFETYRDYIDQFFKTHYEGSDYHFQYFCDGDIIKNLDKACNS